MSTSPTILISLLGLLIAFGVGSAAADEGAEEGLIVRERGPWIVEIVKYGERSACSLIREDADGVAFVISRVSDSPFVLPVVEVSGARDPLSGSGPVTMATETHRAPVQIDTAFDEEGVHIAAYPELDRADAMIEALRVANALTLEQGGALVARIDLGGFDAAYGEIVDACGG